jgi:hypothetical protein
MKRCLLVLLICLGSVAVSQDKSLDWLKSAFVTDDTLKSLPAIAPVHVFVSGLDGDSQVLSSGKVRQLSDSRLRGVKIRLVKNQFVPSVVIGGAEYESAPIGLKYAELNQQFRLMKSSDGLYMYTYDATLTEEGKSTRNPGIKFLKVTLWENHQMGYAGVNKINSGMRMCIDEAMDDLTSKYLKANK